MKIVLVSHVARPSGGEIVLERLAAELALEHAVHVVFFEDGPMAARLERVGAQVTVVPVGDAVVSAQRTATRVPGRAVARAFWRVRTVLRGIRPDVVHAHSLKAGLVAGTAARSLRVPFVWHVHDRISADYLPAPTVALLRAAILLLPSAVAANSRSTHATFKTRSPCAIIPNPVPRPPAGFVRREGRTGTPLVFGLVGRIAPWKGQDLFLRAFASAFPDGPQRAVLVGDAMFGETEFSDSLEILARELGIADRVDRRGFREDIWGELGRLDVLVHASRIPEPFGLVVVEGVLAGLDVIAIDAGGPSEYLRGLSGPLLVARDDERAISDAMRAASGADHPDDRIRLAMTFDPRSAGREVVDLYRAASQGVR